MSEQIQVVDSPIFVSRKIVNVKLKKLYDDIPTPNYSREGDACVDICANEYITLYPHDTQAVSTGLCIQLPYNYEATIRGRSGLASNGIFVHLGTIDSNYTGEIRVIVTNNTKDYYTISKGDRIAQLSVQEIPKINFIEVTELNNTNRGENGFGSSGK